MDTPFFPPSSNLKRVGADHAPDGVESRPSRVLTTITQGLVDELDGAFARIWLLGPGDLCAECYKAADCTNRARCLHLEASAGLYTDLNGEYRRIPLGALKIGRLRKASEPCTQTTYSATTACQTNNG